MAAMTRWSPFTRSACDALLALLLVSALVARVAEAASDGLLEVPVWGVVIIILGGVAVVSLIVIPIACCCSCSACDRDLYHLPTQYPLDPTPLESKSSVSISLEIPDDGYDEERKRVSGNDYTSQRRSADGGTSPTPPATFNPYGNSFPTAASQSIQLPEQSGRLTQDERVRYSLLTNPSTADPAFGEFVSDSGSDAGSAG